MSFDKSDWLKKAIRRLSYRWPPRYTAKVNARVARGKYECQLCHKIVGASDIQMDHKEPVISVTEGFVDWNTYIERMFVEIDGFQAICVACHKEKSVKENETRRASKKK